MSPPVVLDPLEARVLGVLIEKDLTTPDQYPLSINALNSGCNQKSNRDPVMDLSEAEVRITVDALRAKGLAGASYPSGGRVERFHHSAREAWGVHAVSLAVLTELLVRGPQSIGELKTRCGRLCPIESKEDIVQALEKLAGRGFVRETPPPPGSRARRWAQLLTPTTEPESTPLPTAAKEALGGPTPMAATPPVAAGVSHAPPPTGSGSSDLAGRVQELESEVARLRRNLEGLAEKLGETLE